MSDNIEHISAMREQNIRQKNKPSRFDPYEKCCMDMSLLFFGIAPLLMFVIIDSFCGVKKGVIAAIILALIEMAYTYFSAGTIDNLTLGSSALVLVFGLISYKLDNPLYMKLQPVVIGLILSIVFLVMHLMGKPALVVMTEKYSTMMPEQMQNNLTNPILLAMLAKLSAALIVGFLVHALVVAYAAFFMSNWWWIALRGIGFYVMLATCALWVRFYD